MKESVNYLELANSPLMWLGAAIAVGIVVFQSVLFLRKSVKAADEMGTILLSSKCNNAFLIINLTYYQK